MAEETSVPTNRPFLTRVAIKNYKSIAAARADLRPLTFLAGPNGSGKSNVLDCLRFTGDALRTSLDHALRERGGIAEVRRRSAGHPTHFGVRCEFQLPSGSGHYAFHIGARQQGAYEVQTEECVVRGERPARFLVKGGEVQDAGIGAAGGDLAMPAGSRDRLYLVRASGLPEFRPVFDALSTIGFYNLNPQLMRDLQAPDAGSLLLSDGSNVTSVLRRIAECDTVRKERIDGYLGAVATGLLGVDVMPAGRKEFLEFRQAVAGSSDAWHFPAGNVSDGTLRALGILVALFQARPAAPLVGIEEPEMALHPGAVNALLAALREAAASTQVLVTTHSPDLIDSADLDTELLLAVSAETGETQIAPVDSSSRDVLRRGLYTPGELLRLRQPNPEITLFDEGDKSLPLFDRGMETA